MFPSSHNSWALRGVLIACPTLVTSSPPQSNETAGCWISSGGKKEGRGTFSKCGKQPSSVFSSAKGYTLFLSALISHHGNLFFHSVCGENTDNENIRWLIVYLHCVAPCTVIVYSIIEPGAPRLRRGGHFEAPSTSSLSPVDVTPVGVSPWGLFVSHQAHVKGMTGVPPKEETLGDSVPRHGKCLWRISSAQGIQEPCYWDISLSTNVKQNKVKLTCIIVLHLNFDLMLALEPHQSILRGTSGK